MSSSKTTTDWLDISTPIHPAQTTLWPNSQELVFSKRLSHEAGDQVQDTTLQMSVHTGTHIDAPKHFLADGATVEHISWDALIGECHVISCENHDTIDAKTLASLFPKEGCRRLLLKTKNSALSSQAFVSSFAGLDETAAQWLVDQSVALIGIDYLSIQDWDASDEVHKILLRAGIVILEGLSLGDIAPDRYELYCFPLHLIDTEGAPARALLRRIETGPHDRPMKTG